MTKEEQAQFRTWLKNNLETKPTAQTLHNKAQYLTTLVNTYGLDIDSPNPNAVITKMHERNISANTTNTYKTALKYWLQFKGYEIDEDLERKLQYQTGQRRRTVQPKDLLTRKELKDIIQNTTTLALRAYYATLMIPGQGQELPRSSMLAM